MRPSGCRSAGVCASAEVLARLQVRPAPDLDAAGGTACLRSSFLIRKSLSILFPPARLFLRPDLIFSWWATFDFKDSLASFTSVPFLIRSLASKHQTSYPVFYALTHKDHQVPRQTSLLVCTSHVPRATNRLFAARHSLFRALVHHLLPYCINELESTQVNLSSFSSAASGYTEIRTVTTAPHCRNSPKTTAAFFRY